MLSGHLLEHPSLPELWAGAGYAYESAENPHSSRNAMQGVAQVKGGIAMLDVQRDPGVHNYDLGEN
eukprot:1370497-Karenia_brevis.AAC.1